MVYLDYSATTKVNDDVLDTYVKVSKEFVGNPNSLHKLGIDAKKLIDEATSQTANILGVKSSEIIYTSGASESNNTAIKGVALKYQTRGKHIITTELEHSSVVAPLNYLTTLGYEVDFVSLDENGRVNLDDLEALIREDTVLVTISSVNSEVGVKQDLNSISEVIRSRNNKTIFHSDITQSIGKEKIDISCLDLASLSCQKFYGMKGIGILIKKENISIEPLIHGGKSTTIYRSGTPATPLIASCAKALRLVYEDFDNKLLKVQEIHDYLIDKLKDLDVDINSNEFCIPHIVNISLKNIKSEVMLHALEEDDIYVSTQTACSVGDYSKSVYAVTHDKERSTNSLRISISYLTTKEEIDELIESLTKNIESLSFRR